MKKMIRLIGLWVFFVLSGKTYADNLTASDVTMKAGETKEVVIELINPDRQYVAFQFDLMLPNGISIAQNNKGKYIYSLNDDRIDDHTLSVVEKSEGLYRFLSFSMTNSELYENEGALVTVTLTANETFSSDAMVTIVSQIFTTQTGEQYKPENVTFQIKNVSSPGDVNGDGLINISDVTALVNIILGKGTDTHGVADVNGDGRVNISDVTTLVNMILGKK